MQLGQSFGAGVVKRATISAVVTRADGTVEDLGVISITTPSMAQRLAAFVKRIGK